MPYFKWLDLVGLVFVVTIPRVLFNRKDFNDLEILKKYSKTRWITFYLSFALTICGVVAAASYLAFVDDVEIRNKYIYAAAGVASFLFISLGFDQHFCTVVQYAQKDLE